MGNDIYVVWNIRKRKSGCKGNIRILSRTLKVTIIRIPASIFMLLIIVTTLYTIVAACSSYRSTKAKKRALEAATEIQPEQLTCPSCGKEHDLDYPKCPFCGYRVK